MKVYFFNGIGNHISIFKKLSFSENIEPVFITYPTPLKKEGLQDYCIRLSSLININEPFALVGLSFGGVIVTELNKLVKPKFTILISSIATYNEMPNWYQLSGKLKLYHLIPTFISFSILGKAINVFKATTKENKAILKEILSSGNPKFTKWAITKIITWKNKTVPNNLHRIHGSSDKVLPMKKIQPHVIVEKGGHIIVLEQAELVSSFINQVLKS
jgi:hypothetical protein